MLQLLPFQLNRVFPRQASGAMAHSFIGLAVIDHLVFVLEGGNSPLDSRNQALHSQVLDAVGTCTKEVLQ